MTAMKKQPQPQDPDLLTTKEAMKLLRVSRQTIFNLVKRGVLHPIHKQVGRGEGGTHVFYSREEVEALKY